MKYALIFGLLLVVFWLWRNNQKRAVRAPGGANAERGRVTEVVACSVCSVHLPRAEALAGKGGLYCCDEHLQQADR